MTRLLHRRRLMGGLAVAAVLPLGPGGCALTLPPTVVPMNVLRPSGPCPGIAPVLLVMLPGVYSRPAEFVDEGFVAALRERGIAADVLIADAHLGYYNDRSILTRLREDVIGPARAQGYRQIWLVGISLGGFAALGYGARHRGEIDGVLLLAPYLGPRALIQEIEKAGGPVAWAATQPAPGPDALDREIWQWLARPASPGAPPIDLPIYLGYGTDDRFAATHEMLAPLLPGGRVTTAPGGHDWPVWRSLWQGWLTRDLLPRGSSAASGCRATP